MMKFLIFLAATILVAQALNVEEEWTKFKLQHNKSFRSLAYEHERFEIFKTNIEKIEEHNKQFEQGQTTYKMGVNQFTDMNAEEFQKYLRLSGPKPAIKNGVQFVPKQTKVKGSSVDWRDKGIVTGVKDQGQCGACWAFSTTGALEGQLGLAGNLVSLSEQCLVDCAGAEYGNNGCGGGLMENAYQFIYAYGIASEASYPYEAQDGQCRYDPSQSVTKISYYYTIPANDEATLAAAAEQVGPVAVAIEATSNMQHYSSGIFDDNTCSGQLNHGVLLAGFADGYMLVKNSWGPNWGESGYIRMIRNKNLCGIAADASIPML